MSYSIERMAVKVGHSLVDGHLIFVHMCSLQRIILEPTLPDLSGLATVSFEVPRGVDLATLKAVYGQRFGEVRIAICQVSFFITAIHYLHPRRFYTKCKSFRTIATALHVRIQLNEDALAPEDGNKAEPLCVVFLYGLIEKNVFVELHLEWRRLGSGPSFKNSRPDGCRSCNHCTESGGLKNVYP